MVAELRLGLIGAGWIAGLHLEALERLGRTRLVGVVSGGPRSAAAATERFGGQAYPDVPTMLEQARPDVVWVCVPPHRAVAICGQLVDRGIPFLTEKPLAALDADGPARLAGAIQRAGLVVGVGYHLRALDIVTEVRDRLAARPAGLVVAEWLDQTPKPAWWRIRAEGGGQVVEQATHLYDLARHLLGEATVIGAASNPATRPTTETGDVADATAATLRFERGAVGAFANSRRPANAVVQVTFASDGLLTTMWKGELSQGDWHVRFEDERGRDERHAHGDPYQVQAAAFLDAVASDDPGGVLCTYADALGTDRLTRAVVAATGQPA